MSRSSATTPRCYTNRSPHSSRSTLARVSSWHGGLATPAWRVGGRGWVRRIGWGARSFPKLSLEADGGRVGIRGTRVRVGVPVLSGLGALRTGRGAQAQRGGSAGERLPRRRRVGFLGRGALAPGL